MNILDNPIDGMIVYTYTVRHDHVLQERYTYVEDKPCHEVTGCDPGYGAQYYHEWYVEKRYIPGVESGPSGWSGSGRFGHDAFKKFWNAVHDPTRREGTWPTFEEARTVLMAQLRQKVEAYARQIDNTNKILAYMEETTTVP